MQLVYYLVHKYYPTYAKDEDIIQSGMLGLVKAANNYDDSKSKFSTYAGVVICREIAQELKNREKEKQTISLERLQEDYGEF